MGGGEREGADMRMRNGISRAHSFPSGTNFTQPASTYACTRLLPILASSNRWDAEVRNDVLLLASKESNRFYYHHSISTKVHNLHAGRERERKIGAKKTRDLVSPN